MAFQTQGGFRGHESLGSYGGNTPQIPPQTPTSFPVPPPATPSYTGGFSANPPMITQPSHNPLTQAQIDAFHTAQANPPPPPPTASETAWTQYLSQDPFYQQTTGQLSAQGITDASERDRRIAQIMINLGEVPGGYTGPGVTDLIRGLATDNTNAGISTLARLQHAYDQSRTKTTRELAARGQLSSGDTGYALGELGLQNNQSQFDARNQALDLLAQGNYAFNTSETQRQLARSDASFAAAQRAAARGVGPLWEGYGQTTGGGFKLNPIGGSGMNQAYNPITGATGSDAYAPPPAPPAAPTNQPPHPSSPGYQWAQINGQWWQVPGGGTT